MLCLVSLSAALVQRSHGRRELPSEGRLRTGPAWALPSTRSVSPSTDIPGALFTGFMFEGQGFFNYIWNIIIFFFFAQRQDVGRDHFNFVLTIFWVSLTKGNRSRHPLKHGFPHFLLPYRNGQLDSIMSGCQRTKLVNADWVLWHRSSRWGHWRPHLPFENYEWDRSGMRSETEAV